MTARADSAAETASRLAVILPSEDLRTLAQLTLEGAAAVAAYRARSGSAQFRAACDQVLDCLTSAEPVYLAGCLAGAEAAVEHSRASQQLEVVWTGPRSQIDTSRLTSAVVADLIGEAQRELLLVSYATFAEPRIIDALRHASARGVDVTVAFERPADNPGYHSAADAYAGLGVRRVVWPASNRPAGAALHPKLIVVDCHTALVGSANLTGRALDTNMECGVLIRGGPQPRAISEHIWSLIRSKVLRILSTD